MDAVTGSSGGVRQGRAVVATVQDVIDGDTVKVIIDGTPTMVDLAFIRTPTVGTSDSTAECLANQAVEEVNTHLSRGMNIDLVDFGKLGPGVVASVRLADGADLGALLVRHGLAAALLDQRPGTLSDELVVANDAAIESSAGLHSPNIPCTVPGQVALVWCGATTASSQHTSPSPSPTPRTATTTTTTRSASAAAGCKDVDDQHRTVAAAMAIKRLFAQPRVGVIWDVLTEAEQTALEAKANEAVEQARAREADAGHRSSAAKSKASVASSKAAASSAAARSAEASRQAEASQQAEAARRAEASRQSAAASRSAEASRAVREQAERETAERAAAEQAERERAADEASRAEAQQNAEERAREESDDADSDGGGSGSSKGYGPVYPRNGGPPGYTGPRCWLPNAAGWQKC
ncbi:thermonuclease family protein [Nakamurella lactea]|uniref:thermonuclease family protein n=1 Tax=Nakamurella lactea TaxID=459515 RepID=UPI0003F6AD75|nr:hypothetical protein [Nakamurella lactea]